jgi:hypothetical protein
MSTKSKQTMVSRAQMQDLVRHIQDRSEKRKRENKRARIIALTPEEIEERLKRSDSPLITMQMWWNETPPGGAFQFTLQITNFSLKKTWDALYAHVWVGSGNADPALGTFLSNVDTRFARLTEPQDGLKLAPGTSAELKFTIKIPSKIEKTNHLGNSCLMRLPGAGVGTYLDRGLFVFSVS